MSDASNARAADRRDRSDVDCRDHQARASRAGRDELGRYKSDGREPGSPDARSAFRGAAHLALEHPAWPVDGAQAERPYRHVAEPRDELWAGPL